MKRFENIQRGKLTTAYGGVGSIIETKDNGSLILYPFDQWPFYINYIGVLIRKLNNQNLLNTQIQNIIPVAEEALVHDNRLVKKLRDKGFHRLCGLFMPPVIDSNGYSMNQNEMPKLLLADYFPKWFYCPKCRKLAHINEWRAIWNARFQNNKNPYVFDQNTPSCGICSSNTSKNRFRRKYIEQVRFVLASMDNSEVKDLPWDILISGQVQQHGQYSEFFFNDNNLSVNTNLSYRTSAKTDSLYGIIVQTGNSHKNMGQAERLNFIDQNNNAYKLQIKNSTNIYFPETVSSIYIPIFVATTEEVAALKKIHDKLPEVSKNNAIELAKKWNENAEINDLRKIPAQTIGRLIDSNFDITVLNDYRTDEAYLFDEFEFVTSENNYSENSIFNSEDFISEKIPDTDNFYNETKIKSIYCLHKLKETAIQVSYKRIDNSTEGKNWYNPNTHSEVLKHSYEKPTCAIPKKDITFMPAIENFGEGMFLEFDSASFANKEIEQILHTYSHVIMKELEFECGYSLVSLKERLYFLSELDAYGFLIYSINGSDSSYGGITSLFPDKIKNIIRNALERARDCPNDPICSVEGGHCFACTDLPETSCEKFNDELNRIELLDCF